jgi:hypothetical protein
VIALIKNERLLKQFLTTDKTYIMKREMKVLEAKIKELRRVMELFDLFQQDDEVGLALQEVEQELDKFRFK